MTPKMLAQPNELKQLTGSMRELERRMNKSRRTNREARDQKNELLDQIRRLKVDANDFEKGLDIKNSKKYTTKESLFAAKECGSDAKAHDETCGLCHQHSMNL